MGDQSFFRSIKVYIDNAKAILFSLETMQRSSHFMVYLVFPVL